MNKYIHLLPISILLLVFISCNKDDEKYPEPEVFTLSAMIGSNGGVYLSGNYTSTGREISETGFTYSKDSLFTDEIILNSEMSSDNEIEYFLSYGIDEDVKYFFKAFVKSSDKYFYGNTKSFISDGSVAPEIYSISNNFGHIADTLEIYGKNFKDINHQTFVDFSDINAPIISLNDTIILCKVPLDINNVINEIRVRVYNRVGYYSSFTLFGPIIETINPIVGKFGDTLLINGNHFDTDNSRNKVLFGNIQSTVIESQRESLKVLVPENLESPVELIILNAQLQNVTYHTPFQLPTPEINSISPLNATFRDEITITGNNFQAEISGNKIYFGNIEATITYADRNTLKVTVPDDLESSSVPVKVLAYLQEAVFNENFQLIPPEINFIPENVYTDQLITIQGSYFHPIINRNIITIENIKVNSVAGDAQNLNIRIPMGPFPRRKAKVEIQLLDLVVEYEIDLNILDAWVMVSDNLPFRYWRFINNAAVANDKAFVIAHASSYDDNNFYLWRLNPDDFSWDQLTLPFSIHWTAVMVSNGDKIYIYNAENDNDFWEFDPITEQWSQMAAYPGAKRDLPTHFSINGDIYIGMGADYDVIPAVNYWDFFKYSTATNSWNQIAEFTYQTQFYRAETSTFTINNIAYMGNGATNTGMFDYWSYHPDTDEWIRVADFPDARLYTASFELNGFGYTTCGTPVAGSNTKDCWRYDPLMDNWTQIEDIGNIPRANHFSFSLNGKAYLGGGEIYPSGGDQGFDFYEYLP